MKPLSIALPNISAIIITNIIIIIVIVVHLFDWVKVMAAVRDLGVKQLCQLAGDLGNLDDDDGEW